MRQKGQDSDGDYKDDYSPVPVASSFHAIISLATYVSATHTQLNIFTDSVLQCVAVCCGVLQCVAV